MFSFSHNKYIQQSETVTKRNQRKTKLTCQNNKGTAVQHET